MPDNAQDIIKRSDKLFNAPERRNAESNWAELAEFIIPALSGVFQSDKTSPGVKKTRRLFDSTGVHANITLAQNIQSIVTNAASKWVNMSYKRPDLNNDDEALAWLDFAEAAVMDALNESNFYSQLSQAYLMLTALGTFAVFHDLERTDGVFDKFKFKAYHLAEIAIAENAKGIVDTVYRKFEMTAKQIEEKWPDSNIEAVKNSIENNDPYKTFEILHCLYPREASKIKLNEDGLAPPDKRPYASMYILRSEKEVLEEGGYYEFPVYVVRWQVAPGESYGRGPGYVAIPDIRSVNKLKEESMHAVNMSARPMWMTTARNVLGTLRAAPGAVNVVRDLNQIQQVTSEARFDVAQLSVQDMQAQIHKAFFLDKLELPPRQEIGEMTMFETAKRLEHMQRVLGPIMNRFSTEFQTPLIIRCFRTLLREGVIPPPPESVAAAGVDVDIAFVNQLTRAQQMDEVNNIQGWLQEMAGLAQIKPEALDFVNEDFVATTVARIRGIPEGAVRSSDEVQQIREQRQQQQQAAQAMEAGVAMADINSKVNPGGNNGQ